MSSEASWVASALVVLAAAMAGIGACSSNAYWGEYLSEGTGGNRALGIGGSPVGGSGHGGGTGTGGLAPEACPGVEYDPTTDSAGDVCTGALSEAKPTPLDLMILVDRTLSMTYLLADGETRRWDALRAAVGRFVTAPHSQEIRVGVQFFSLTGNRDLIVDCDPNAYVDPWVEIGPLSDTARPILDAMDAISAALAGQTPSAPALQGVIWHAQDWQRANPGRQTAVLLVTDGLPNMCPTSGKTEATVDDVVAVAEAGAVSTENPRIATYVIGVAMGASRFNLSRIAAGGGTRKAYLTGDSSGDASADLITALGNITTDPLACEYLLPDAPNLGEVIDAERVRVVHTDGTGKQEQVPYATSRGVCSNPNGGWYYDNATSPSKIVMCPCTCANFSAGRVSIEIGCRPAQSPLG